MSLYWLNSPILILCLPKESSPKIPRIRATFHHPLFLLSSIVSRTVPLAVSTCPRYFELQTSCISWEWTFNVGHVCLHFVTLPICMMQFLSSCISNLCISTKKFITAFFSTAVTQQTDTLRVSLTMPSTMPSTTWTTSVTPYALCPG